MLAELEEGKFGMKHPCSSLYAKQSRGLLEEIMRAGDTILFEQLLDLIGNVNIERFVAVVFL